jgi:two-component system OmpR family response regulator
LVVDDDEELRGLLSLFLTGNGFRVSVAQDAAAMTQTMSAARIDLIILDIVMPGEDGLSICRRLHANGTIPIIMLTAKGSEFDRVVGLEIGADDYLSKPFSIHELLARVRAVLRRAAMPLPGSPAGARRVFEFAGWHLDVSRRELRSPANALVDLRAAEFDVLLALVERPQRVLTRDQLLDLEQPQFGRDAAGRREPAGPAAAASTRWHGTMIGNGFVRDVRLSSRHVHFLEQPAPDPTVSLRQRRAAPIQMHFVGQSLLRAVQRLRRSGALVRGRMPGAWNRRTRHESRITRSMERLFDYSRSRWSRARINLPADRLFRKSRFPATTARDGWRSAGRPYSRASGPNSGTRRGRTRAFRIGPVVNQAAPTRPPGARAPHAAQDFPGPGAI